MKVKMMIEYDGTNYAGWQRQQNALSIQQVLEEAFYKASGEKAELIGAGRTDAGVHALGQAAHLTTQCTIPPDKISYAMNLLLPADIRIRESMEVSKKFHAQYSAIAKHYRYSIYNAVHASAVYRNMTLHIRQKLNVKAMQHAAGFLVGTKDFKSFQAAGSDVTNTVRKIHRLTITESKPRITVEIVGNGFLYNMVRIIVGTLIEIGQERHKPEHMNEILLQKNREKAGPTAAAQGLTLVHVYYGDYDTKEKKRA